MAGANPALPAGRAPPNFTLLLGRAISREYTPERRYWQVAQGRIADRVAIVTGGGSGIGKATVEVFAQEGARVIVGDLPDSAGEDVAKAIGGTFVATDVGDSKQIERLVRTAVDKFGRLDIMYNNAGIGLTAPLLEHSDELYAKTIRVDLDSVFYG